MHHLPMFDILQLSVFLKIHHIFEINFEWHVPEERKILSILLPNGHPQNLLSVTKLVASSASMLNSELMLPKFDFSRTTLPTWKDHCKVVVGNTFLHWLNYRIQYQSNFLGGVNDHCTRALWTLAAWTELLTMCTFLKFWII